MTIIVSVILVTLLSYIFSDYIKKYSLNLYLIFTVVSITAIVHAIYMLNNYSIVYIPVLKQIMKSIDSGALGGSFFILVMYMGVMDMRFKISKKLRINRGELSILATIITIPHNVHYFFAFILGKMNISNYEGIPLWASLMMFAAGVFAILIMIPLFITSFKFFRKKMTGKSWKNLQEYAYIFYAMVFIQVMMVYILKPSSIIRNINIVFYIIIFGSYTIQKVKIIMFRNKQKNLKNNYKININSE